MSLTVRNAARVSNFRGAIHHSKLSGVGAFWSHGTGMRPLPGRPPAHTWGMYLTANVKGGHSLQIDNVKISKSTHTVTITADARGIGAAGAKSKKQEQHVQASFGFKAENWTVIVKDSSGKQLMKRNMSLGGPPA